MFGPVALGTGSAVISVVVAYALRPIFKLFNIVDDPQAAQRKVHRTPIVMVGGVAIALACIAAIYFLRTYAPSALPVLSRDQWVALAVATVCLLVVGVIDDRFNIRPLIQLLGPVAAALIAVRSGIVVTKITNPNGGIFSFEAHAGISHAIAFIWLMVMMYSTKLLDGLDGLSTGLSGICALMIFALTRTPQFYQPGVGNLAIIFAGACAGFLILNFHPARAFLGEGGSVFVGFALGILSIMSGSKIATALLVMAIPVFDVVRVMLMRKMRGKPVFSGDRSHLHYLLLENGISHRAAVVLYYVVGAGFGLTALVLQSKGKAFVLLGLIALGWVGAAALELRLKKVV